MHVFFRYQFTQIAVDEGPLNGLLLPYLLHYAISICITCSFVHLCSLFDQFCNHLSFEYLQVSRSYKRVM